MTSLSVISKGFLGALIGGSLLLWAAVVLARRRDHRLQVVAAAAGAVVLTLLTAADLVNAHYQYLPRLSDVLGQSHWPAISQQQLVDGGQAHPRGAVVSIAVPDSGVGFSAEHALVFLPPEYFTQPDTRFPVVYLLHGSPGIPIDWLRGADAAKAGAAVAKKGQPQILVMPKLSRNWLDDSECVDGSKMRVETYLTHDVVPAVDAQLRTKADRADRVVGGMSAGGYCALNLGLRNRNTFGEIVDMSGFTHPTHSGGMTRLFGHRADLTTVVAANSPDVYAADLPPSPATSIYLLCGTGDHAAMRQMAAVRDELRSRGFDVSWNTRPGGHTYGVWRPGLAAALAWSGAHAA
ncbi:MAG TPA: alpha/beta hydrolase-fold protein [Acidothermaceae bacterium]|nr:alpha/beta hydrolase-fold protein [Acidothermaceae bacterium]